MIWSLQVLRFVAAMMVVYLHATHMAVLATGSSGFIPLKFTSIAASGVDIFFVLSGVVIAKTATRFSPGDFLWRRIRRVMPIYLVCSIPAYFATGSIGWRDLLASVLLWPATDVMTEPLLPIAWTLCYEMLFYVSAAVALVDRRLGYALLAGYAICFLLRPFAPIFQFLGNPLVIEFLFGVAIARAPMWRYGAVALPAGLILLVATVFTHDPLGIEAIDFLTGKASAQRLMVYGIPAALIVYGSMHIEARKSVWTYLGDASYSIYLVHITVVTGLLVLWKAVPAPPDLIVTAGVILSLVLAWRVHELIEKPLLRVLPLKPTIAGMPRSAQ